MTLCGFDRPVVDTRPIGVLVGIPDERHRIEYVAQPHLFRDESQRREKIERCKHMQNLSTTDRLPKSMGPSIDIYERR